MNSKTAQPAAGHHGLAALLAALSAVGPFSIDAYLPSMRAIEHSLNVDALTVQQTLTAYMIPFAAMTLWHGAISDALGRRRVILWGLALFTLASAACAFARTNEMLLLCRALQGMTAGAGIVVGRAIVRDKFHGAEAQRVMSQITLTFALAPAIAPVLGGWLEVAFGWRSVFVFMALFASSCWILCRFILEESLPPARRQPFSARYLAKTYSRVMTSRRFLAISLASTLIFSGFFIYVTSAPVFLMRHLGVPETGFLWLFGPSTIGMAIGSWLSGRVAGKVSPRRTLWYAFALMGGAVTANVLFHLVHRAVLPWSVAPLFLYVLGMSFAFPTLTLLGLDIFPSQRGLAASCLSFVQMAGAATNAVVAPLVWGSPRTLAMASAAALVLAAIAAWMAEIPLQLSGAYPVEKTAEVI
jgi:DHA1 family bicyclomycin/chloramphenicol resistance-like MFS transporter